MAKEGIEMLVPVAILFVVAFFIFSIGSTIMEDLQENYCDEYTWYGSGSPADSTVCSSTNPLTNTYSGCCLTTNASADSCTAWYTKGSLNISYQGAESIEEMSSWGPTLALVVIAAIIISVLIMYLARGSGV